MSTIALCKRHSHWCVHDNIPYLSGIYWSRNLNFVDADRSFHVLFEMLSVLEHKVLRTQTPCL